MTAAYKYGDTSPITVALKTGVAVAIADMCLVDEADSYKLKPAGSLTWVSAVSTPSAPTGATETGCAVSDLTSGATGIKVAYIFPWGEGTLSSAGSVTVTGSGDGITLHGIALPDPAVRLAVYVETAQGSGTYKLYRETNGEAILIVGYGVGRTPPTAQPQTATALTQFAFNQRFVGCSAQRYDGSNASAYGIKDGKLRVDTGGVFQFDCASASFNPGDLVGPAKASGNTLEPQKVVAVTHPALAIGRVVAPTSSETTVLVRIMPTRMGAQPPLSSL